MINTQSCELRGVDIRLKTVVLSEQVPDLTAETGLNNDQIKEWYHSLEANSLEFSWILHSRYIQMKQLLSEPLKYLYNKYCEQVAYASNTVL